MVAPAIGAAGVTAGVGLLGGLFGAAAEKKRQQRELAQRQQQEAAQTQVGAAQALSQGQQLAFERLVGNFGKALGV